jgi:hypothetical protein
MFLVFEKRELLIGLLSDSFCCADSTFKRPLKDHPKTSTMISKDSTYSNGDTHQAFVRVKRSLVLVFQSSDSPVFFDFCGGEGGVKNLVPGLKES